MEKTFMIVVMVLILNSLQSEAFPNGAPSIACRDLIPRHAPNQAADGPFPYEVDLSELALATYGFVYEAGRSYRIQLRGTSLNRTFRGFLIQARTVENNTPVGNFSNGNSYQQACTNNTAATHTNNQQKRNVSIQWTAPPTGTGPIKFWFSFVDIHRGTNSRFWASEMSNVVVEECPSLSISNGKMNCALGGDGVLSFGVTCSFTCSTGYKLTGSDTRTCQCDGSWSGSVAMCSRVTCPSLSDPSGGMISCALGDDRVPSYEDTCSVTCNTGYELTGSDTRTCQSDGSWSGSVAMCNRVTCPSLSDPSNGMISCSLGDDGFLSFEDTCSFTCNTGYELSVSYTRTCQSDGSWSGMCSRVTCPSLSDPSNGMISCSLGDDGILSYEDTCSFTCDTGYELTDGDTRTCQSDGSWSGSVAVCSRVTCPVLSDPSNGMISCSLEDDGVPSYEDTCSFICDTGYELTGSDTRICQSDGSWSGSFAMCSRVTCPSLSISNGTLNCTLGGDGVLSFGDTCSFTCDTGYELTGSDTRTCQSDGSWSGSVAMCSRVTCPSLSIINGMMNCLMGDNTYEDTCSFTCDTGYELSGSDTRTCQSNGSWSGTRVSCDIMKCPILSLPLDSVLPEACNNTYQSICELQCSEGFNGTGNSSYMCDVTGSSVMWRPLGDVWTCDGDPPPPEICAAGDLTAPLVSLSSVKAAQEIVFEEDHPIFWIISINNARPEEYARVIPLLLSPVSLAFSSDVTNILGEMFVISVTLMTRNGNEYKLTFTSMGIVNSTEVNNVEVLQFNAEVTGSYSSNWDRELDRNHSYTLFLKEDTAGEVLGESRMQGGTVKVMFKYDSKDNERRFNNVRVLINYTALDVSTDDSLLSFNLTSETTGWNSSCPVGSGGFRCYACKEGYYGRPRVGIPCRECMCNGHSSKCHSTSGRCFDCADNTRGKNCHICDYGYVGDAVNGVCQLIRPPTLFITGNVSAPDVGLEEGNRVEVSYLLDGSEPAKWEITLPDLDNLTQFAILFPLHLSSLQFILTDNATFFNGTFNSVATVERDDTFFTLNIAGSGLSVEGNLTTITFDATAYGDFDSTSYTYDLSELTVSYEVNEDTPGSVELSTSIETDLSLEVVFEYSPIGPDERPFDEQQFIINQSSVTAVDNKLVFSATNSLIQVPPPPTICAIGNFSTPITPLSSVKAFIESPFDEDKPVCWEIIIPNNANQTEYPRVLPLILTPVSLAFSSNVLDVIGDIFTVNMTLTTGRHRLVLAFTSTGFEKSDNFEILHFNGEGTGQNLLEKYVRGFESDVILMDFREETPGSVIAVGDIGGYRMRLDVRYDSKTATRRFANVDLIMNHTDLSVVDNTMKFKVSSVLVGWNSSCPLGSAGFRCYRCIEGYFGAPRKNIPCRRCMCNGHSDRCHHRTGRCMDCADSTRGRHCENCASRYYGNATNGGLCNPCQCDPDGSRGEVCNIKNGQCRCYHQIIGRTCDTCAQEGYYGPQKRRCRMCRCHPNNTLECTKREGQCRCHRNWTGDTCNQRTNCPSLTTGDICESCIDGYYGDPNNGQPCQKCICNNNIDLNVTGNCNSRSGKCLKCVNNTVGDQCERCALFYYGDAINGTCIPCGCNHPQGARNRSCNMTTGQCNCRPDITGRTCDTCVMEGFYGPINHQCRRCRCVAENTNECNRRTGECSCKDDWIGNDCSIFNGTCPEGTSGSQCDVCIVGYYGNPKNNQSCQKCNCSNNNDLTVPGNCHHVTGRCSNCLNNTDGDNCEKCAEFFYGDAVNGECISCGCNHPEGARSRICNMTTGQCDCRPDITGRTCNTCVMEGFYGPINRQCRRCRCVAENTNECNRRTGECSCKDDWIGDDCSIFNGTCPEGTSGSQCDVCIIGYYGNPKNNQSCQKCNCSNNNDLTVPGNCHRVTGRCSNCLNNTDGDNCEMCAEFFYGDAVNGECISCGCNHPEGARSRKCNMTTGQCECRPDITGRTCDTCVMEGFYGPINRQCRRCRCVAENTNECNRRTGECSCKDDWIGDDCSIFNGTCPEGTSGSQCDVCIIGYYGNPKNNQSCQKCNCSNNNDLTVPGNCHRVTGRCSNCLNNTDGDNCEMCAEFFYGDAVNGECISCGCNRPEGARSRKCNMTTGQCECRLDITGRTCDTCVMEGFYGPINHQCRRCKCVTENTNECNRRTGECSCKDDWIGDDCSIFNGTCPEGTSGSQCDVCTVGYYGNPKNNRPCQKCNCSNNNNLTVPGNCHHVTGRCSNCLNNTKGDSCEICAEGFYGDAVNGECIPCNCNPDGSTNLICDPTTGECSCKRRVVGRACDRCRHGTSGFSDCELCRCKADRTYDDGGCDPITGQCHCLLGYTGLRCGNEVSVAASRYNGSSYSPYTANVTMTTMGELRANVGLENENGILYYFSEFENGTGSYFLTRFVNYTIELSFCINGSMTVIRGTKKLPLGQLMRIVIVISEDKVSIRITLLDDVLTELESITEPISITIITAGTFYAGGVPPTHKLPVTTSNLIGCMEKPITVLLGNIQASPQTDVGISPCSSN